VAPPHADDRAEAGERVGACAGIGFAAAGTGFCWSGAATSVPDVTLPFVTCGFGSAAATTTEASAIATRG
jgi:hypothetical protein